MQRRIIKVTAFRPSLKHFSGYYIGTYKDYDIEVDILQRSLGVIKDTYILQVEGTCADIQLYFDYLTCNNLKIHNCQSI